MYQHKRKLAKKDNLLSSLSTIDWAKPEVNKKPKLFKKKVAGASSLVCNNTNLFVQIDKKGKKKCP